MALKPSYETGSGLKFVEEDVYSEGCLPETQASHCVDVDFKADSMEELIDKIQSFFSVERDAIELDACDEEGRIDIALLEDADGTSASEHQIEQWKDKECRLWYCIYSFQVEEVLRQIVSTKRK